MAWLSGSPDRPDGPTRQSGAGRDQLSEQLLDAEIDVVTDAADHLDRLAGRLLELATELPELPHAPIEVGGMALEQVGDMGAGCLVVVAEAVGIGSVA